MEQKINLEDYLIRNTDKEDSILSELYRETYLKAINPRMISGHLQGNLLKMISKIIAPHNILEIGTFTGYSSICLAEGLQKGGVLHTIEENDELEPLIKHYIKESNNEHKIQLHIGKALEIIPQLDQSFQLAFIDADKKEYLAYYKAIFPFIDKGGVILADNVLWNQKVLQKKIPDDLETNAIIDFNDFITRDPTVEKIILPIRDGIFLIRKL